jgi:hypothetical protein
MNGKEIGMRGLPSDSFYMITEICLIAENI